MQRYGANFVPKPLDNEQRYERRSISAELLERVTRNPRYMNKIITGDEIWFFEYDSQTSEFSFGKKSPRMTAGMSDSTVRCILVCFFNSQGIVHLEWIPNGQEVNSEYYVEILKRLLRVVGHNQWILHHDNVPFHTTERVTRFLNNSRIEELPHPANSPDLAPCDFFLFPKFQEMVKRARQTYRRMMTCRDIQNIVEEVITNIPKSEFTKCYREWKFRWEKCVEAEGDYFEDSSCSSSSARWN